MTFIDEFTLKSALKEFRNYDIEWEFIKQMDYMGENMHMPFAMIVNGESVDWVGEPNYFSDAPNAVNENGLHIV